MAVKEFFETHFYKWRNRLFLSWQSLLTDLQNQLQCIAKFEPKALKGLFFVLIMFITVENMSCIHIKQ